MSDFSLLLALRYLRLPKPRSNRLHIVTAIFVSLTLLALGYDWLLQHPPTEQLEHLRPILSPWMRLIELSLFLLTVLVSVFIVVVQQLTLFSTIATFGLFLGSSALVIILSVMSGFEGDLQRKILSGKAEIVVESDQPIADYGAVAEKLGKIPGVVGAAPYINTEVILTTPTNLSGVVLYGIDPDNIGKVSDLLRKIDPKALAALSHPEQLLPRPPPKRLEPDPEDNDEPQDPDDGPAEKPAEKHAAPPPPLPPPRILPAIIVGRDLANELSLYVGDEVSLISPFGGIGPTGAMPKAKRFRVAGVFYSGLFEYDHNYAYIAIPAAQRLMATDDVVDGLQLKIVNPEHPEPIAEAARKLLPPETRVQDWKQLNRGLFSALKLERILMFVVLGFVILVAAFSIIANGMMLVLEKRHEIAILKAMGASDASMLRVFLLLGLTLGGLGAGGGIAIGTLGAIGLRDIGFNLPQDVYYLPQLPVRVDPVEIALIFAVSIVLVIGATLYPALMVARLRPVDGLRL